MSRQHLPTHCVRRCSANVDRLKHLSELEDAEGIMVKGASERSETELETWLRHLRALKKVTFPPSVVASSVEWGHHWQLLIGCCKGQMRHSLAGAERAKGNADSKEVGVRFHTTARVRLGRRGCRESPGPKGGIPGGVGHLQNPTGLRGYSHCHLLSSMTLRCCESPLSSAPPLGGTGQSHS